MFSPVWWSGTLRHHLPQNKNGIQILDADELVLKLSDMLLGSSEVGGTERQLPAHMRMLSLETRICVRMQESVFELTDRFRREAGLHLRAQPARPARILNAFQLAPADQRYSAPLWSALLKCMKCMWFDRAGVPPCSVR